MAVAGEAGVTRAVDLLSEELTRSMNLMGCTHLNHLEPDSLFQRRMQPHNP